MAKARKGSIENPITTKDLKKLKDNLEKDSRTFKIIEASINDDFCNYKYEIISGIGLGDEHGVKGKGIIKDEMRNAFIGLNVHLAYVDDVFKHAGLEIENIIEQKSSDLAQLYNVTGFKIKGGAENESIIIIGNKYVSSGGRINLETPKISIDDLSGYKFYYELKQAADAARLEVALYKEGNYIPVEVDDEEEDPKQGKLDLSISVNDDMSDFDKAEM